MPRQYIFGTTILGLNPRTFCAAHRSRDATERKISCVLGEWACLQVGMSTPEWKSVDLEHGRCVVAKIVSGREVHLRFVKST